MNADQRFYTGFRTEFYDTVFCGRNCSKSKSYESIPLNSLPSQHHSLTQLVSARLAHQQYNQYHWVPSCCCKYECAVGWSSAHYFRACQLLAHLTSEYLTHDNTVWRTECNYKSFQWSPLSYETPVLLKAFSYQIWTLHTTVISIAQLSTFMQLQKTNRSIIRVLDSKSSGPMSPC